MKRTVLFLTLVFLIAGWGMTLSARKIDRQSLRIMRALHENENPVVMDQGMRSLQASAQVDSFCLVWYDFETMNWQGWERVDLTAQHDTFFHVDDFSGLGGGHHGWLVAIEGTKSMWCGTRGSSDPRSKAPYWYLCSWVTAPGYGNSWDQMLTTVGFDFSGILTLSCLMSWDSEPDYDFTRIEYDAGFDNWVEFAEFDGTGIDSLVIQTIVINQVATKLRFHFTSDTGWSDQDGLWNTDGAVIVDSITVSDEMGLINFEDWEDEVLDAMAADNGFWYAHPKPGFGSYAKLKANLIDEDPCGVNYGTQIVFWDETQPGVGWEFHTPFCRGPGGTTAPCQNETIVSPIIDMTMYSSNCDENQDMPIPPATIPGLGGLVFRFTVYRDLPLSNLVFYTWGMRSLDESGCPGQWQDRNFVNYGPDKEFLQSSFDISDFYQGNDIQVWIGVVDMCDVWFNVFGDCASHTATPWFDNIRLYRYSTIGPQWYYRALDLFQDNFPEGEFDIESYVRADAANDLRSNENSFIDPGDSAVVRCSAPKAGGLDTLATGEPRVYCHLYAEYIGDDGLKPDLYGPSLEGSYGTYVSDDGSAWTIFLCPPAGPALDRYMVDLNDSLFTRGYQISYYFKAYDLDGNDSTLPADAESGGDIFEFTCLPTLNSDILYVDDFHGRGTFEGTAQVYWDNTFSFYTENPDRYDVNSPSSMVSNGPGSRASNFHLISSYEQIIWDSGNLGSGTITEGTSHSDKSNDAQMLIDWLMYSEHKVGLWVLGDEIASDLGGSSAPVALGLMATICGVEVENSSYYELTGGRDAGGIVSPEVTGLGIYSGLDYFLAGGCPLINSFDVLATTGPGAYALRLPDCNSMEYYIGISTDGLNAGEHAMRTSWIGHSFMYVRNGDGGIPARNEMIEKTWQFFDNEYFGNTDADLPPAVYALMQNYPNPFNPVTRIRFDLPVKGHVKLRIYNVAGQLVKTLTDEQWKAGAHTIDWNGTNNTGSRAASGVYFYRLDASEFCSTKKMVLLR